MGIFRTRADSILDLQRQLVAVKGEVDELRDKHERLRGAFYQARQGLAADGETPIAPRGRGRPRSAPAQREETRDEFKARKLGELRGKPTTPPDDTQ